MEEKYIVYFTGCCVVWANSPEDAEEKFDRKEIDLNDADCEVLSIEHDWYGYEGDEY